MSPGLASGPARLLSGAGVPPADHGRDAHATATELARLEEAIAAAGAELEALSRSAPPEQAGIFQAQRLMLEDPELADPVREAVRQGRPAATAVADAVSRLVAVFEELDQPYYRERAADIRDLGRRLLDRISGEAAPAQVHLARSRPVVVADELLPSQVIEQARWGAAGFAAERGGPNSHAAIIARALGLPAVFACPGLLERIRSGQPVTVDGWEGTVSVGRRVVRRRPSRRAADRAPALTTDGRRVLVCANVSGVGELEEALSLGADGVGVLRTELAFLRHPDPPGEQQQADLYREMARMLEGRPLTVRCFDAGSDKPLAFLPVAPEPNPALGMRGTRLLLARPQVLEEHLRAILQAGRHGRVQVLFPMVATAEEFRAARRALRAASRQTRCPVVPSGAMVEVPSAALAAAQLAASADFLSVGTNDLTQYLFAADRQGEVVSQLYSPLHPVLLRLILRVARACARRGIPVHLCGELAADPAAIPLLVGMGIDELSVSPPAIPAVKRAIRECSFQQCRQAVRRRLR